MTKSWALRDPSSLFLFHKIDCGATSIDKGKYTTRLADQDCRPQTDSDILKYAFSPELFFHWNSLSLLRSQLRPSAGEFDNLRATFYINIFSYSGPSGIFGSDGKQYTALAGARGMRVVALSIDFHE